MGGGKRSVRDGGVAQLYIGIYLPFQRIVLSRRSLLNAHASLLPSFMPLQLRAYRRKSASFDFNCASYEQSVQERGERWLTANVERRGERHCKRQYV